MAAKVFAFIILSLCLAEAFGAVVTVRRRTDRVRPCSARNTTCVGRFLAGASDCSRRSLSLAKVDPLFISRNRLNAPFFNITAEWRNVTVTGLKDATLSDFFYNRTSKQAVMAVRYPTLTAEGDLAVNVLSVGEEIIFFQLHYTLFYKDVTITTVFKDYRNIDYDQSVTFGYLPAPVTSSNGETVDPKLVALGQTYPEVQDLIDQEKLHPEIMSVEVFRYRAANFNKAYINAALCQFQ